MVVAQAYYLNTFRRFSQASLQLHEEIINGIATSPYRYRILVPYTTDFLGRFVSVEVAYMGYFFVSIFVFLLLINRLLNNYSRSSTSLLFTILFGALLPIYLKDHFYQPWTILEAILFTLSLFLLEKNRTFLLGVIIFIATLNRETGVFIIGMYGLYNIEKILDFKSIREKVVITTFTLVWIFTYGFLRFILGNTEHISSIYDLLISNLELRNILLTINNWVFSLGILWFLQSGDFLTKDPLISRVRFIIPFYLLAILVFGVWYEVRLMLPVIPIFLVIAANNYDNYLSAE
jgi:hypothetical protein